jgi:hypothetical protein
VTRRRRLFYPAFLLQFRRGPPILYRRRGISADRQDCYAVTRSGSAGSFNGAFGYTAGETIAAADGHYTLFRDGATSEPSGLVTLTSFLSSPAASNAMELPIGAV